MQEKRKKLFFFYGRGKDKKKKQEKGQTSWVKSNDSKMRGGKNCEAKYIIV